MTDASLTALADLLRHHAGQVLTTARPYLVEARLAPILRREGFSSLEDLTRCLHERPNPSFEREVAAALVASDATFFRGRTGLERIAGTLAPAAAIRAPGRPVRIWCAGGGAGHEAYSLAILLARRVADEALPAGFEICSTDLSREATVRGAAGVFDHFAVQRGLSIHHLLAHFDRIDSGDWQARTSLRDRVQFSVHNLLEPADAVPAADIILCRNVVRTMTDEAAGKVARTLSNRLAPGGVILFGEGEPARAPEGILRPSREVRGGWIAEPAAARSAA